MKQLDIKNNSMIKAIIGVALLSSSAVAAPAIWDGSADVSWYESSAQAYNLTTAEQLAGLAKLVNDGTSSFEGKTITLGADIFLNDTAGAGTGTWASTERRSWTPIGMYSRPFKGELDGMAGKKNRKIYGLYLNDKSKNYVGLFGYTSGAKINNIDLFADNVSGGKYVGSFVGYGQRSELNQVSAQANVTGTDTAVGGLAGYIYSIKGADKNKISFRGNVNGLECVGGLAGVASGDISNAVYSGSVSGKSRFVGGLVGDFKGNKITNSSAEGKIIGELGTGGLIGYIRKSSGRTNVDSSHFVGTVSGKNSAGGIAGGNEAGSFFVVRNSYSEGSVLGTGNYVGGITGWADSIVESYHVGDVSSQGSYVGGLAGFCYQVRNSYSEGAVTGNNRVGGLVGDASSIRYSHHKDGDVNGSGSYVGGLAGQSKYIDHSYSEGSVTSSKGSYVGGLVGYSWNIDSSYHKEGSVDGWHYVGGLSGYTYGSVIQSYSVANVTGKGNYIGGLIGYLNHCNDDGDACHAKDSIVDTYSVGDVSGKNYVGGLIGLDKSITGSVNYRVKNIRYIRSFSAGLVKGYAYVGGLLGQSSINMVNSTQVIAMDSCYHKNGEVDGDSSYVGGLIGYFVRGSVSNSYSEGNVRGTSYVGGLLGYSVNSFLSNSYTEGNVTGSSDYVGGLAGFSYMRTNLATSKEFQIIENSHAKGNVDGINNVGGVIGRSVLYDENKFKMVRDSSVIIKFLNTSSLGNVTGQDSVGGLVGATDLGKISNDTLSYAKIIIDSSYHEQGNVTGNSYVGGIAGFVNTVSIFNSHQKGDIQGSSNFVGGLIGARLKNSLSSYIDLDTIQESYSIGNVEGEKYVGGLIGLDSLHLNSGLSRSFILSANSEGNVTGLDYVGGAVGATMNLSLLESYSRGDKTGLGDYVGGLIGFSLNRKSFNYGDGGLLDKNTFFDSISYSIGDVKGHRYVGGLIGLDSTYVTYLMSKEGYYPNVEVTRVVNEAYSMGRVEGFAYVGGLIGCYNNGRNVKSSFINGIRSEIKSSYHGGGSVTADSSYVGGLVGYASGTLDSTYHIGDTVSGYGYVGGVAGRVDSVRNSYSKSNVLGNDKYVGGLVGYGVNVLKSFAEGATKSDSSYVGGLVGYASGTVDFAYHEGGSVSGYGYVGGLVGRAKTVWNSWSKGDVFGKNKYVGGLAGYGVNVSKSFAEGGTKSDSSYVGGLVGSVSGMVNSAYHMGGAVSGYGYVGGLTGSGSVDSSYHIGGSVLGMADYVGGLTGYGSVKQSYSEGSVLSIGYIGGLTDSGTVDSSYHIGGGISSGGNYVGGLSGSGSVDSSYHIGGDVLGSGSYVGGLTGNGSVSNSYSEGNVAGLDYVGGVAGSSTKIRNSNAKAGYVKGRNSVGGLVGYATDSIDVSYFEGDSVTGIFQVGGLAGYAKSAVDSSYSTANVKGDDNAGGLIGSAYGNVSNSYALGNVIGDVDNSSAGNDNLGGLVGYQYSGSVSKSMALGNVSGTTKLGGLVGRFDGTAISQSYANGNVTGNYYGDPADEVGNYYIGGLVGYAKGSLNETYSSGIVKGVDEDPVYTGCMVGYVNGSLSVTNSYYDKSKCSLGIDGGEESVTLTGVPDKTTAEMQTQSTFEDWNFVDIWKIVDDSYPFLQIYANSLTNATVETASLEGYKYDGKAKTPLVLSVKLFGETLEYETEYTIAYENNVNAGTAHINICGVKPYGGCKVVDFDIAAISVEPTIAAIENMTYTGRALTPEVKVYNGETLLASTDYNVEYKNNVNAGTATVVAIMNGNYSGTASKTFTIEKATPEVYQTPKASDVIVGQTLEFSELTSGSANVEGTFVWKIPGSKPTLENEGYAVVFVPADTANYTNSEEIVVPIKVLDMAYVAVHAGIATIDSMLILKGSSYALPNAPDSVGYDFVGFYQGEILVGNVGDEITISENTVIDAVYKIKTFIVTFMNGSTVLQSGEVAYGVVPITPKVTLPENTAQYTYSFGGWDKEIVAVTKAATYNAVIDSVVNKYQVVFKDYDGTVLKDSLYAYGTLGSEIVMPADTVRATTAQYTYIFKGWTPEIDDVTKDAAYTAQYDSTVNVYEISFVILNDILQSTKMDLAYGTVPVYEGMPTRASTAQYSYAFKGWSPEIVSVSGVATYTAVFDSTVRTYTITFVNGTTSLQSNDVAYGTLPEYTGITPIKEATAQYTYTFKSWNPAIVDVAGEATYTAVFDSVVNKYEVTFKNGDEVLQSSEYEYGTMPNSPDVPLPENTAQYIYSFAGWDKEIVAVTGPVTYTAVITNALGKYQVTFKDYDGSILMDAKEYDYGTAVKDIVKPTNPARASTAQYTYTFKGWTPEVSEVKKDVEYVAEYDSTLRNYMITFVNGSEEVQKSEIDYGKTPVYEGKTPIKDASVQYTYTFKGWTPSIKSVSGLATYKAVFDSIARKYAFVFKNGDVVLAKGEVAYGVKPKYSGKTPTKPETDSCTYVFSGWSPELKPTDGDAIYTAQFEIVKKTFTVRFTNRINNRNALLEKITVSYGEMPEYTGETPTKKSSANYTYEFAGWSPSISAVKQDAEYKAVFDSTKITGIADSRLVNMEMSVNVISRNIQVSAAPMGSVYAILDVQGRVLQKGIVETANFNIAIRRAGSYLVQVGNRTRRVDVK